MTTYWRYFCKLLLLITLWVWYRKQIWHHDVPFFCLSMQLDNAFAIYDNFHTLMKRRKNKELSQFLKVHISETPGVI